MPRQPYLSQRRFSDYMFGPDTLEQNPRLALLIGSVAHHWTNVELNLALLMGALLGVENGASVAVLTALRNNRSRRDALAAAADASLAEDDLLAFQAIMNLHSKLDKLRNDIIHGVWGYSFSYKEGVLWQSVQSHATAIVRDYHSLRPDYVDPHFDRQGNIKRELYLFPYEDLDEALTSIMCLAGMLGRFHAYLRMRDHVAGQASYRELLELPLFQEELAKLGKPN